MSRINSIVPPQPTPIVPTQLIANGLPSPPSNERHRSICDTELVNSVIHRINQAQHAAHFAAELRNAKIELQKANQTANTYSQIITELQNGKAFYENLLQEAEAAKSQLQQERDLFERNAAVSANELRDARAMLASSEDVEAELEQVKQELEIVKECKGFLEAGYEKRTEELAIMASTLDWTSQELHHLIATAVDLDAKLHSALWKSAVDNAELRKDIEINLDVVDHLRNELEYEKADRLKANCRVSQVEKRSQDLQTRLKQTKSTNSEQESKISALQKGLQTAGATIDQLRSELCDEKSKKSNDSPKIQRLEVENDSLNDQLKNVRDDLRKTEESKQAICEANERLEKDFTKLKAKLLDGENKWRKTDKEARGLDDYKKKLKKRINDLEQERDDLRNRSDDAVQEKNHLQARLDALKAKLAGKETTWNKNQDRQTEHVQQLRRESQDLCGQVQQLQEENQDLREKHACQQQDSQKLRKENHDAERVMKELKTELEKANARASLLQEEIDERDEFERRLQAKKRVRTESFYQIPAKRQKMDDREA